MVRPGVSPAAVITVPLMAMILCCSAPSRAQELRAELRFPARAVTASSVGTLNTSGVVYLWTSRSMSKTELNQAEVSGLRFLGVVQSSVYAFQVMSRGVKSTSRRTELPITGSAQALPEDKLNEDMLRLVAQGTSFSEQGYGLDLGFWPQTRASEVRALIGEPSSIRLPADDSTPLGPDSMVTLKPEEARWLDLDSLMRSSVLAYIGVSFPKALNNAESRGAAGTNVLYQAPFNLSGAGILIGEWDGGSVDSTHPDFGGRVVNRENAPVNAHATHVAGTILGQGAGRLEAAGHAPGAELIAFDFNGAVPVERREAKHNFYHHHDSHSWGVDPQFIDNFSAYDGTALQFDTDARDLLLLGVKAAGNEGQLSEVVVDGFGFDSLSPDSTGKNMLVVGAIQPDLSLAPFSSRGPVEDGRVKPDIVAVGVGVLSTRAGGGHVEFDGTSMSTPGVSGMLGLLSQLFERDRGGRRMAPDVARGVMIHTAQDAYNPGPDYRFGWGIARVDRAAQLIQEDSVSGGAHIVRGAVRNGEQVSYQMEVPSNLAELKVTLSWLDAALNAPAQRQLINDIDLSLRSPGGTTYMPWVLDKDNPAENATRGRNVLDNVEQVVVDGPEAGTWTLVIDGANVSDLVLNVQGFVLLTDHPIQRSVVRVKSSQAVTSIPDGSGSLDLAFDVNDARAISSLRVFLDVKHQMRGDLRVELIHPDGTTLELESDDASPRRDIYAIYPDLRSYDDDVTALYGKSAAGSWTVRVSDVQAGNLGELRYAELELDVEGIANGTPIAQIQGSTVGAVGGIVPLSGLGSADPENEALTYTWTQVAGPLAGLQGAATNTLQVTIPNVALNTELEFQLEVSDGQSSGVATHQLRVVEQSNAPPAITITPNSAVAGGSCQNTPGAGLHSLWILVGGLLGLRYRRRRFA